MEARKHHGTTHPFFYVGLILLAVAVVTGLLADHPEASAATVISLDLVANLSIAGGLVALILAPLFNVLRYRN